MGELIAEIKTDNELKKIPVVIMTSSQADEDILKSYNLHANSSPLLIQDNVFPSEARNLFVLFVVVQKPHPLRSNYFIIAFAMYFLELNSHTLKWILVII
jgi:CheY-like chemotaxis protein